MDCVENFGSDNDGRRCGGASKFVFFECSHSALRNVLGCQVFWPSFWVCSFQRKRSGSSDTHAASVAIESDGPALVV